MASTNNPYNKNTQKDLYTAYETAHKDRQAQIEEADSDKIQERIKNKLNNIKSNTNVPPVYFKPSFFLSEYSPYIKARIFIPNEYGRYEYVDLFNNDNAGINYSSYDNKTFTLTLQGNIKHNFIKSFTHDYVSQTAELTVIDMDGAVAEMIALRHMLVASSGSTQTVDLEIDYGWYAPDTVKNKYASTLNMNNKRVKFTRSQFFVCTLPTLKYNEDSSIEILFKLTNNELFVEPYNWFTPFSYFGHQYPMVNLVWKHFFSALFYGSVDSIRIPEMKKTFSFEGNSPPSTKALFDSFLNYCRTYIVGSDNMQSYIIDLFKALYKVAFSDDVSVPVANGRLSSNDIAVNVSLAAWYKSNVATNTDPSYKIIISKPDSYKLNRENVNDSMSQEDMNAFNDRFSRSFFAKVGFSNFTNMFAWTDFFNSGKHLDARIQVEYTAIQKLFNLVFPIVCETYVHPLVAEYYSIAAYNAAVDGSIDMLSNYASYLKNQKKRFIIISTVDKQTIQPASIFTRTSGSANSLYNLLETFYRAGSDVEYSQLIENFDFNTVVQTNIKRKDLERYFVQIKNIACTERMTWAEWIQSILRLQYFETDVSHLNIATQQLIAQSMSSPGTNNQRQQAELNENKIIGQSNVTVEIKSPKQMLDYIKMLKTLQQIDVSSNLSDGNDAIHKSVNTISQILKDIENKGIEAQANSDISSNLLTKFVIIYQDLVPNGNLYSSLAGGYILAAYSFRAFNNYQVEQSMYNTQNNGQTTIQYNPGYPTVWDVNYPDVVSFVPEINFAAMSANLIEGLKPINFQDSGIIAFPKERDAASTDSVDNKAIDANNSSENKHTTTDEQNEINKFYGRLKNGRYPMAINLNFRKGFNNVGTVGEVLAAKKGLQNFRARMMMEGMQIKVKLSVLGDPSFDVNDVGGANRIFLKVVNNDGNSSIFTGVYFVKNVIQTIQAGQFTTEYDLWLDSSADNKIREQMYGRIYELDRITSIKSRF